MLQSRTLSYLGRVMTLALVQIQYVARFTSTTRVPQEVDERLP